MSVIVLPLHIELYWSQTPFLDVNSFRNSTLPLVNQVWSQADIRFEQRTAPVQLNESESNRRLDGRLFHQNEAGGRSEYEPVQLRGIASGQPATGFRICIMHQWNRTETANGVERPLSIGNTEGVLAAAIGAGGYGIEGIRRTIVARPAAALHHLRMAHEIGHLLIGAGHPDPPGYLMANSRAMNARITDSGIARAQAAARRVPGHRIQN